jgi:hypothetical protein
MTDILHPLGVVLAYILGFFGFIFVMFMLTCWFWKIVTWLNQERGWFQ